jgi:hypothetical protein
MDLIIGSIVERLIKRAVRKLSEEQRDRCEEEWLAHIRDTPGALGKFIAAVGFLRAARTMSSVIPAWKRVFDILLAVSLLFFVLPLIVCITIAIKVKDGGPILAKRSAKDLKGQPVLLLTFRTGIRNTSPGYTLVGEFLRNLGLHNLPVLINLLCGTITLQEVREVLYPHRRSPLR